MLTLNGFPLFVSSVRVQIYDEAKEKKSLKHVQFIEINWTHLKD